MIQFYTPKGNDTGRCVLPCKIPTDGKITRLGSKVFMGRKSAKIQKKDKIKLSWERETFKT